jgi:hypothetical protein
VRAFEQKKQAFWKAVAENSAAAFFIDNQGISLPLTPETLKNPVISINIYVQPLFTCFIFKEEPI